MAAVLPPQRNEGDPYTYSSQPRTIPQRSKYREKFNKDVPEDETNNRYGNLMYDRRVIRGNTYSQHAIPLNAQPDPVEIQRQAEMRRRALLRKQAREQLRPKTPEALEGRMNQDVQTELYLEELSDRIEEADVEVQTDAFLDRPPSPLFVPAKTGIDIETQIEAGELFDFDIEVQPILEVLVGKTVEQSLLEVMEEEELADLRSQQRMFEELRNAELVEQQRLEEQERRHSEEKRKRIEQQNELLRIQKETAERIAARAFAHSYLSDLVPSVIGSLYDYGYFYDPIERDVEQSFMPWLLDEFTATIDEQARARTVLDGLLREVVQNIHESFYRLEFDIKDNALQQKTNKMLEDNTVLNEFEAVESQDEAPAEDEAPAPQAAAEETNEEEVEEGGDQGEEVADVEGTNEGDENDNVGDEE